MTNYIVVEDKFLTKLMPKLYYIGQIRSIFNFKQFILYLIIGLIYSLFIFLLNFAF